MAEATREDFQLDLGDVHIWEADLDAAADQLPELRATLSRPEAERADRFVHEKARHRFVAGRGIIRALLARYLQVDPRELSFTHTESGKPSINSANPPDIRFNLSHAGPTVLYAITRGRDVGVDVEEADRQVSDERIACRFFAAAEVAQLEALPADERRQGFLRCWTRKEAYVKALGEGMLSSPPSSFAVSLCPEEPALLNANGARAEQIDRWRLEDLSVDGRYIAAVCLEAGEGWRVVRKDWTR